METINGIELKGMDSSTLKEFILGRRLKFTLVNGSTIIGTVKLCECASNINPAGGGNLPCDIIVDDVKINIMTIKEIKCLQ